MQTVTIFILSAVFFIVGSWMHLLYRRDGLWSPNALTVWGLFALSRGVVVLISGHKEIAVAAAFLEGLCFLVFWLAGYPRKQPQIHKLVLFLATIQPMFLLSVAAGVDVITFLSLGVEMLFFFALALGIEKLDSRRILRFYPAYFSFVAFGMIWAWSLGPGGDRLGQLFSTTGKPPMLLVLGLLYLVVTVILVIVTHIFHRELNYPKGLYDADVEDLTVEECVDDSFTTETVLETETSEPTENVEVEKATETNKPTRAKFGWKDLAIMLGLTGIFGVLVFFGLGAKFAPETTFKMSQEEKTSRLTIDLGESTELSEIVIFLGGESHRTFSVSVGEKKNNWTVVDKDCVVQSVYTWNHVEFEQTARFIYLVSRNSTCLINEIIILDKDGNVVTPVNAEDFPELFDEQEKYPHDTTYYYRMMFDEVYHGRTGYEFLHGIHAYENTHPPLGKVFISWGIKAFGMTPFGWRFACAICGILMIPYAYMFGWKLSRKTGVATAATLIMCTMFMNYTLSRIATVDIIVALFVLMTFYYMFSFMLDVREKKSFWWQMLHLVLCGFSVGLAMATKWTGVYAAAGICALFFIILIGRLIKEGLTKKNVLWVVKLFFVCVVSFLVIPAIIYVLSYIPFKRCNFPDQTLIQVVLDNAELMLSYHKVTIFEHAYSAEWYEWLIDRMPLLDAITNVGMTKVSSVSTFLNPLLCFGGLVALFHHFYLWFYKKDTEAAYLTMFYLTMLAPWWFIVRTVFIYQYMCSAMALVFMVTYSLTKCKKHANRKLWIFTILSILFFIGFFACINGYPISRSFVNDVSELFESWGFA